MPRDINDVYTLPAGNPVISDTIISTDWANSTLEDIAQALTDSLDKSDPAQARDTIDVYSTAEVYTKTETAAISTELSVAMAIALG